MLHRSHALVDALIPSEFGIRLGLAHSKRSLQSLLESFVLGIKLNIRLVQAYAVVVLVIGFISVIVFLGHLLFLAYLAVVILLDSVVLLPFGL